MGENCLNSMSTVFGFVYFVYLYLFLGVFQNHILLLFIIQKSANAPLMFLNNFFKIINGISEFSRSHFLLYKITSSFKTFLQTCNVYFEVRFNCFIIYQNIKMNRNNLNFVSNNVKGLQSRDKRIKLFEYLKNYISSNGFVVLQETHSGLNVEKKWADEFKGQLFFSHGKTNSCGVAIGYIGNKPCSLIRQIKDNHGRLLVLEVKIDSEILILINIYNANTESEQLSTLTQLNDMLINVKNINNKNIILDGDFNMRFYSKLEAKGGKPVFKKQSIAKMVELLENFDLCDIWRIRNLKNRRFNI